MPEVSARGRYGRVCPSARTPASFGWVADVRHDGFSPALDLSIQVNAAADVYAQAAVVVVTGVLPSRPRVVPFESRVSELSRVRLRDVEPESLSRARIRALVYVDPEDEPFWPYAGDLKEPQEEFDQRGIAIDEADSVPPPVRLVLDAFAPVGDCSCNEDFSITRCPDLCGRGSSDGLPPGLACGRSAAQYLATASAWRLQHSS